MAFDFLLDADEKINQIVPLTEIKGYGKVFDYLHSINQKLALQASYFMATENLDVLSDVPYQKDHPLEIKKVSGNYNTNELSIDVAINNLSVDESFNGSVDDLNITFNIVNYVK